MCELLDLSSLLPVKKAGFEMILETRNVIGW